MGTDELRDETSEQSTTNEARKAEHALEKAQAKDRQDVREAVEDLKPQPRQGGEEV